MVVVVICLITGFIVVVVGGIMVFGFCISGCFSRQGQSGHPAASAPILHDVLVTAQLVGQLR
jgi:hypothetical protein